MKRYAVMLAMAVAAILTLSDTAQAARWVYRPAARVRFAPRISVRTAYPVVVPYTTTLVTPTVAPSIVIGPRGRLHYVTPLRPVVPGPTIIW